MFDDDPRWGSDPRERDGDSRDPRRGGHDSFDVRDRGDVDPRDVFVEKVDLPRGLERELVRDRDRKYSLRGSETRTLSILGAFRVVSSRDLRDYNDRPADPREGDLRHLREEGLIRTIPMAGTSDEGGRSTTCWREAPSFRWRNFSTRSGEASGEESR